MAEFGGGRVSGHQDMGAQKVEKMDFTMMKSAPHPLCARGMTIDDYVPSDHTHLTGPRLGHLDPGKGSIWEVNFDTISYHYSQANPHAEQFPALDAKCDPATRSCLKSAQFASAFNGERDATATFEGPHRYGCAPGRQRL
jgi:hypothetical protein